MKLNNLTPAKGSTKREKRIGRGVLTFDNLIEAGLVSKNDKVKILGNGELTVKLEVTADAFSKTAIAKIEALEGKAIIL